MMFWYDMVTDEGCYKISVFMITDNEIKKPLVFVSYSRSQEDIATKATFLLTKLGFNEITDFIKL